MDKSHTPTVSSPGYETQDASARGVFAFLVILCIVLIGSALVCWGVFRHFAAQDQGPALDSVFSETQQFPSGPQLQVHPRQDLLDYREEQEKSLETYAWEDRSAGLTRVPIEEAMQLLLKKGLPVQAPAQIVVPPSEPTKAATERRTKK